MSTRSPAVAGLFYSDDPAALRTSVQNCLTSITPAGYPVPGHLIPKALALPHAGYVYSGPIAASGYRLLKPLRNKIRRVVLLGPSHRVNLRGVALPTQDSFTTPLGEIPLDTQTLRDLAKLPQANFLDSAHEEEHSLEVQLPFLQEVLGHFQLVPIVVGESTPEEVAEILNRVWGGDETLIIISTDLSHYQPYASANSVDRQTANRIVHLQQNLEGDEACGCRPLNGLLLAATQHRLRATLLDLRNSGDTSGSKDHVVGYGAFAFHS